MKNSDRTNSVPIGFFIPLAPWRKRLAILFLALISTWIVPPSAIAYELAKADQEKQIEQAKRDQRTKASPHFHIARQNEATSQLLIKTCRQIENNVIAGKPIDSEIKDIEAFQKNFEEIKQTSLKQMDVQRTKIAEREGSEKMLERVDTAQKNLKARFETLSGHLKSVVDNQKKPEELKKAVRELAKYLEETSKKSVVPQNDKPKGAADLPRRSDPAKYVSSILSSIPHNGILLASADKTIGDWLVGTDSVSISGPASAADLTATPEIVIDDEIRDLAASFENHPVKIFEYVRNNFVYEPYWGSQKGAKRTLLEKAGNDIDLASLTMAMLRAAGINCRYVCGTIEMTIEEAGKWIGVDDPTQIAKTFQANGIPFTTTTSGGKIATIKLNHTWIVAYVDYFPYHGTRNEKPNTWIEIDPSFKQNTFTMKSDLQTTIGINPDTLLVNVKAQSELGADNLYAAKVPESFILSEIFSYQEPIRSYLAANSLTSENVFRQRKVNEERYGGLFTVTDNYKIVSRGLSFNAIPDSLTSSVTFSLKNDDNSQVFTYTTKLSAIADARITLGYKPATDHDRNMINSNAAAAAFPVYMVNLMPEFKIDNTVVGTGSAIGMGKKQILEVSFKVPGFEPSHSQSQVTVGSFSTLVPDYQNVTAAEISRQQARLSALSAGAATSRDEVLGEALRGLGLSYWHQLDRFNQVTAGNLGVAITRVPSMIRVAWDLNITDQFGLPFTATIDRIKLFVINDYNVPVAISADKLAGEKQFAFTSALTGTALEHNVLAQPFAGEAASAARVIQQANKINKKVYTVTATNVNTVVPLLDLPAAMINDIRNAVNAGQEVTVPESAVNLNGIEYFAYARRDIETSASEFHLDSRGGEMQNTALKATDLLLDGSAENYKNVAKPMADWLNVAVDSTTNAGLAYLPAITALNSWYAKRTTLDPVTTIAAIIAVSGPITKVYNQPAVLNVVTGDKLISPNGDGIKDSFTLSAVVTRNAAWKFQILNAQNQVIITEENNTPNINIDFSQKIPDGTYSYRITASANGVNADPISGTFRVDCTKPTVAFSSPDPATTITQNKSIALRGTADDINFEKVVITAKGVGAEVTTVYESNNITVENLLATIASAKFTNGPLVITMTAWDKAGNSDFVTRTFNLDNPVPDLQAPTVNMIAKNSGADIVAGSTVDAESGKLDINITAADNIAVTKINLLLDGAIAATTANATELAHVLNTMTLRDGAHTLQAEAYDAAGNSTKTALLNFTLTSPVSNFKVSPTLAKPGTSQINVSANLREAANWTLTFNGPGNIPAITGTTASVTGSFNPASYAEGEYTVTLTVNDKTPSLPFIINMILNRPTAKIANLSLGADDVIPVVREGLFTLVGTADDVDVADTVSYKVEVLNLEGEIVADVTPKPLNTQKWREGRVANASLGELDFTLLRNNVYTLRLTVTDGQFTSTDEADFALNSELKIGQMSFSQQDLVIPVNGHPISVIRTYNSLNSAVKGDFGFGWTYSIKDIEVELSENRQNTQYRDWDTDQWMSFSMRTGGSRDVTVTMPDGKRVTFRYGLRSRGGYFPTYEAYWTAPAGVYASLVPTCSSEMIYMYGLNYWSATGPNTDIDNFDFPGFILTLKDGTQYEIARENLGEHIMDNGTASYDYVQAYGKAYVKSITDTNGNRTVFETNEIVAYNATGERSKSIRFDRNNDGLISAIYAPSSLSEDGQTTTGLANFKYEYDNKSNLVKVQKLIDRTKPVNEQYATTEYLYEEPTRPNFVTSIKDALGNVPMKCIYDDNGRLIATEDSHGNRIELNHDIEGKKDVVYDRLGNPTIHIYDERGNVLATTDPAGNTKKFTYDSLGNQTSETDALGFVQYFTYDSKGNRTQAIDSHGKIITVEYDGSGNRTKMIDSLGYTSTYVYDSAGNILSITNALGHTESFTYDAQGNKIAEYGTDGKLVKSYQYDFAGNMIALTYSSGLQESTTYTTDGLPSMVSKIWTDGNITKLLTGEVTYNDAGQAIEIRDIEGNISRNILNLNGKLIHVVDKLGNKIEKQYDSSGNLVMAKSAEGLIRRYTYDNENRVVLSQDQHLEGMAANGIRNIYNSLGHPIRIEKLSNVQIALSSGVSTLVGFDEVLSSTSYHYDALGRKIKESDSNGNSNEFKYDSYGNIVETTDSAGKKFTYTYDSEGRRVSFADSYNNITKYEYDAEGQCIKTIFPDGNFIRVQYNTNGLKIAEYDAEGKCTKFEYDDSNNLVALTKEANLTNHSLRWEYTYDQYGNRTSIKDPSGRVTQFRYNHQKNLISRSLPMGQNENFEYDSFGRKVTHTGFKGQKTEYSYDSFGRNTKQLFFEANVGTPATETEIIYDAFGRVSQIIEERGTTDITYLEDGKIHKKNGPEGWIEYKYDPVTGNKTEIFTAFSKVKYTYDGINRLQSVETIMRNGQELVNSEITAYQYNKNGVRSSTRLANGVEVNYHYDNRNRLSNIQHKKDDFILANFEYGLSPSGRRISINEKTNNDEKISNVTYQYDDFYRLIKEKRIGDNAFEATYVYDVNGNRTEKRVILDDIDETISYTYNNNDQLISENSSIEGITSYSYDNNGSLLRKVNPGKTDYYFSYNERNLLSNATILRKESNQEVSISTSYSYDYNGGRVGLQQTATVNSSQFVQNRFFLLDDGHTGYSQVFEEMSILGSLPVKSYVLGDDVISQTDNNNTVFFHYDGHGSTRLLSDKQAVIIDSYSYDAYGRMLGGNPNVTDKITITDLLYAGEQFDPGLQMEYLRARYYDQNTGTFTQIDQYAGNPEDPQSLHKYAYCHSDPINNIDPTGLYAGTIDVLSVATIMLALMMVMIPIYMGAMNRAFLVSEMAWIVNAVRDWVGIAADAVHDVTLCVYTTVLTASVSLAISQTQTMTLTDTKVDVKVKPRERFRKQKKKPPIYFIIRELTPTIFLFDSGVIVQHPNFMHLDYLGPDNPQTTINRSWVRAQCMAFGFFDLTPYIFDEVPIPLGGPLELDEFPYASTIQGGAPFARGMMVPADENHFQGGTLSGFYRYNESVRLYRAFALVLIP